MAKVRKVRKLTAAHLVLRDSMSNENPWRQSEASNASNAALGGPARRSRLAVRIRDSERLLSRRGSGLHMLGFALVIRPRSGEDNREGCGGALVPC